MSLVLRNYSLSNLIGIELTGYIDNIAEIRILNEFLLGPGNRSIRALVRVIVVLELEDGCCCLRNAVRVVATADGRHWSPPTVACEEMNRSYSGTFPGFLTMESKIRQGRHELPGPSP